MQDWEPGWEWDQSLRQGNLDAIHELLKGGSEAANQRSGEGETEGEIPVTFAVEAECPEAIPLLAVAGADLNARVESEGRYNHGDTALCRAARGSDGRGAHLRALALLLELGADPNLPDGEGYTPLYHATQRCGLNYASGSIEALRLLLQAGVDPNRPDPYGQCPLDEVYVSGAGDAIRLLLTYGACMSVDTSTTAAAEDLSLAVFGGDIAAVDSLLTERRVDINARDRFGRTALHAAALSGNAAMVAHLLACGADPHAREDAYEDLQIGEYESKEICLSQEGMMPLHLAASEGHLEAVRLLLAAGADVNATGDREAGRTPLMYALVGFSLNQRSETERMEVVHTLLEAGADVHAVAAVPEYTAWHLPWTVLGFAAAVGSSKPVALLLERGAANGAEDLLRPMAAAICNHMYVNLPVLWKHGRTLAPPLRLIHMLPYLDSIGLGAMLGEVEWFPISEPFDAAILNEADPATGETPLMWMARHVNIGELDEEPYGHEYRLADTALLLKHGADVTLRDRQGRTALDIAEQEGNDGAAALLRRKA